MSRAFKENWKVISDQVNECCSQNGCGFISDGEKAVLGDATDAVPLMILFDAPSLDDGIGQSLLISLLDAHGIDQSKYYISNVIKCCSQNVADNKLSMAKVCRKHLASEFKLIRPKIIMLCGSGAYEAFFGVRPDGNKVRGVFMNKNGFDIITTCNPCIAADKLELKLLMYDDVKNIKAKLESL